MAEIQPLLIHTITWTSNAHMCSCRHMNHRSSEAQTHVTDDFLRYLWIGLVWSSCFLNQNVSICIKIIIWMCKKQIMMLQKGILILICVTNTLSRCLFFLVLGVSRYKQSRWCMRTDDSHRCWWIICVYVPKTESIDLQRCEEAEPNQTPFILSIRRSTALKFSWLHEELPKRRVSSIAISDHQW